MQTTPSTLSAIIKLRLGFCSKRSSKTANETGDHLQSIPAMFLPLIRFALAHYHTFIDGFDPVRSLGALHCSAHHQSISPADLQTQLNFAVRRQRGESSSNTHFNPHFAIPFFTILYAALQGVLGFDFFCDLGSFISSDGQQQQAPPPPRRRLLTDLTTSADFVPHQIFPRQMWAQSDLVLGASTANMLLIYFNLMRRPMLPSRYHMLLHHYYPKIRTEEGEGKQQQQRNTANNSQVPFIHHQPVLIGADHVLSRLESYRILKLRQRVKLAVKAVFAVWFIGVEIYFNYQLLFSANMAFIGLLSGLYWTVVAPAFVIYGIFTNMLMIVFFLLSLKYLHIKQEALLEQMSRLTASFSFRIGNNSSNTSSSFRKAVLWRKYHFLNGRLIFLCEEIDSQGRFWCRYLTSIYTLYIGFITYSVYALFLVQAAGLFEKSFFALMIGNSTAYLILVIRQCSKVVQLNRALERQNALCLQYFKRANFSVESLLKAGNVSQNQLATFYGIRLINNYLIDSNTLHLTFYYITSFFMLNFANMV